MILIGPEKSQRRERIEVVAGRDRRVGDTFDTVIVAQRHGRWVIVSSERDTIVVSGQ